MMQYSLFFILCLHGYFYTVIRLFNLALLHGLFDDLCILIEVHSLFIYSRIMLIILRQV